MKKKKFLLVIVFAALQLYSGIICPGVLRADTLWMGHKGTGDILSPEICINGQVFRSVYNDFCKLTDTNIPAMLKEREREVQTAQKKRGDDHVPSFLKPDSRVYKIILVLEKAVKVMLFDCQMCGQCRLMYTGFICPMQCPKQMGLGPCGGSVNGVCELGRKEETWEKCVWCSIYDRLNRWDLLELLDQVDAGPLNHTLHGSSSWINAYLGRIRTPDKQLREKIAKKIFKYYKQKAVNLFKINRTERLEKTSFIQWSI